MELLFLIGIIITIYLLSLIFTKSDEEKKYEKKLKESLSEEYIIDPQTGEKLEVRFDDLGNPIITKTNQIINQKDIDKSPSEADIQIELAIQYLRESNEHSPTTLTSNQLLLFENTKMLSKYDSWTYSNPWNFKGGVLFFPAPEIYSVIRPEMGYSESQLMYWRKINNTHGHFYLREKTFSEKVFDKIKSDDILKLKDYECFTIKKRNSVKEAQKIVVAFESHSGLEIEIDNDNLFVKTLKLVSKDDILRIELILKTLGNIT